MGALLSLVAGPRVWHSSALLLSGSCSVGLAGRTDNTVNLGEQRRALNLLILVGHKAAAEAVTRQRGTAATRSQGRGCRVPCVRERCHSCPAAHTASAGTGGEGRGDARGCALLRCAASERLGALRRLRLR